MSSVLLALVVLTHARETTGHEPQQLGSRNRISSGKKYTYNRHTLKTFLQQQQQQQQ
jgi:hypothetical protein